MVILSAGPGIMVGMLLGREKPLGGAAVRGYVCLEHNRFKCACKRITNSYSRVTMLWTTFEKQCSSGPSRTTYTWKAHDSTANSSRLRAH